MTGPIARGTLRTTFVLGLRLAVQTGTLLLVARMLGAHSFGAFAGVAALAVILGTLSTFGTHLVLLGEVAQHPAHNVAARAYAIPTTLTCGVALLAVYLIACRAALPDTGIALTTLVLLGATETLLQPLITLCAAEHHGLGHIARAQLIAVLPLTLRLAAAATVFSLKLNDPLGAYACGYALASLVALGGVLPTLPATWRQPGQWRLPRATELRSAAGFAALNISAAGPTELDKTLATRLLPLGAAGLYSAAARVIAATTLPVSAMTAAALPRLFREGSTQPRRTHRLLRWMFAAAFGYGALITALLWLAAPLFDWLFGAQYHGIDHVIRWLCLAIPGMALRRVAGTVLMALGKPWMRVAFEVLGLLVLGVASVMLTARLGSLGLPVALSCSEWSMAVIGGILVWRHAHAAAHGPHAYRATSPERGA